jgi:hypothetical protein
MESGLENDARSLILRGMRLRSLLISTMAGLALAVLASTSVAAQTPATGDAVWASLEGHGQLRSNLSALILGESKSGTDYSYQQWIIGAALGFQLKSFARPHLADIDPDREHAIVLGAGYEYLQTDETAKPTSENRIIAAFTPRWRPPAEFLITDRNRVEFRWVNGDYSARYRNRLTVERASRLGGLRFTPYLSAEFFYDWAHDSWNEEQYAVGFEWPYKSVLKLNTYYLRQTCTTCSPRNLNVAGLSLNYFYRNPK